MNIKLLLLLSVMLFSKPTEDETLFWGQNGHRVTAEIAKTFLTAQTKLSISKLLKGQSMAFVSTYPDELRGVKKYKEFTPWHFANMGLDETYEASKKNPYGDLVVGINKSIKFLKDKNSTTENKVFYLKMLIHLIGDLHQPLHLGRKVDEGGNTINLRFYGVDTNLHSVWDSGLIEAWKMSYKELAEGAKYLSIEQIEALKKGTVIDWLDEVHKLTKTVYDSANAGDNLSYNYSFEYVDMVRNQLQIGGIRLAKVLNDIFDEHE